MAKKKLPKELAHAIACSMSNLVTSIWDDGDACCTITHVACGKSHTTEIYRKQETAERNAEKWMEKHLTKCRVYLEANEAFKRAEEAKKIEPTASS